MVSPSSTRGGGEERSAEEIERHDDLLLALARSHPNIDSLVETFFSWLGRRTDFFHVFTSKEAQKMGFPPGHVEVLVRRIMREHQVAYWKRSQPEVYMEKALHHHQQQHNKSQQRRTGEGENKKQEKGGDAAQDVGAAKNQTENSFSSPPSTSSSLAPSTSRSASSPTSSTVAAPSTSSPSSKAANTEEDRRSKRTKKDEKGDRGNRNKSGNGPVDGDDDNTNSDDKDGGGSHQKASSLKMGVDGEKGEEGGGEKKSRARAEDGSDRHASAFSSSSSASSSSASATPAGPASGTEQQQYRQSETTSPSPASKPEKKSTMSTWNGGTTDRYCWSQSISDVTAEIFLERKTTKKEIRVDLRRSSLRLEEVGGKVLLEGTLGGEICPEESFWSLEDEEKVLLSLEKNSESWWKCLLEGDPKIDTTKVESVKRVEEYDEQTQGHIRKIVFDQRQKAQGLPTSDELKTHQLLKEAWDAEGSPFKGQPFDPSVLNIQSSSSSSSSSPFPPLPQ